jgi:tyrosyl-DNA phosphodiesterase 2
MNDIFQKAVKDSELLRKSEVPWKSDEPFAQPLNVFDVSNASWTAKNSQELSGGNANIAGIALFSWNIDFMLPFGDARMKAALDHLGTLVKVLDATPSIAPVIFLQECTPEDLKLISSNPWVRERFALTDLDATNWATSHYGTTTLLDKRLTIQSVFRVHYSQTRMDRDALFVDVGTGLNNSQWVIRLCNSHLESLVMSPPLRPAQMGLIARYLHAEQVQFGITAGDFNAIQPFDRTLHTDNDLKDAFLERGGKEDTEEGYTWGQQAATKFREQFGCSRMDKAFFCGKAELLDFNRFGQDIQLPEGADGGMDSKQRDEIVALGFDKPWITDHLGICVKFQYNNGQ